MIFRRWNHNAFVLSYTHMYRSPQISVSGHDGQLDQNSSLYMDRVQNLNVMASWKHIEILVRSQSLSIRNNMQIEVFSIREVLINERGFIFLTIVDLIRRTVRTTLKMDFVIGDPILGRPVQTESTFNFRIQWQSTMHLASVHFNPRNAEMNEWMVIPSKQLVSAQKSYVKHLY